MKKRYWRCFVCNDIHYGVAPPELCPTCKVLNAYVEISAEEARKILGGGAGVSRPRRVPGGHRAVRGRPGVPGQSRPREGRPAPQGHLRERAQPRPQVLPLPAEDQGLGRGPEARLPLQLHHPRDLQGRRRRRMLVRTLRQEEVMAKLIMFHGRECPHCKKMMPLVEKLEQETGVRFDKREVWHDEKNADLMRVLPRSAGAQVRRPASRPDVLQYRDPGRRLRRGRIREAQGLGAEAGLAPGPARTVRPCRAAGGHRREVRR